MPRVSVIIPNYRHARFLPKRIESVLGQSFEDIEVLFLDDASPDDSLLVFNRYNDPRMRLMVNEVNSGSPFPQWDKGIAATTGQYIWLAESDDFAAPQFLATMVAFMDAHPTCVLAQCQSHAVDAEDNVGAVLPTFNFYPDPRRHQGNFISSGREAILKYFLWNCIVPNASAALIRREACQRGGGVDVSLRLAGDWKLYISLLLHGDLGYVAEPLNYFRTHSGTVRAATSREGVDIRESYDVLRYVESVVPVPPADSRRRRWQLARWHAAARPGLSPQARERVAEVARAADPSPARLAIATVEQQLRRVARRLLRHQSRSN